MQDFLNRRDRFDFFENFENPLINITFKLETVDFLSYCKSKGHPPFHFFLYHVFQALVENENFKYRIYEGEVIRIDEYIASYTVMNQHGNLNYTRFKYSAALQEFINRSLKAKIQAENSTPLINTGAELGVRQMKDFVFITSIPWLDFTSIQHPVFKMKSADIPSIAWGRFTRTTNGVTLPFSVQAHHGFVDGHHIHLLATSLQEKLKSTLGRG